MRIRCVPPVFACLVQAVAVAGTWALRSPDGSPGLRLELIFDSTAGSSFRARVAFLMQGDVGMDPSLWQPGRGEIEGDTLIRVELRATSASVPPSRIVGRLAGDTIVIRELVWAGEDRAAGGRRWILVRQASGRASAGIPTQTGSDSPAGQPLAPRYGTRSSARHFRPGAAR